MVQHTKHALKIKKKKKKNQKNKHNFKRHRIFDTVSKYAPLIALADQQLQKFNRSSLSLQRSRYIQTSKEKNRPPPPPPKKKHRKNFSCTFSEHYDISC